MWPVGLGITGILPDYGQKFYMDTGGHLHTRAKSRDHEIMRVQKKVSKGHPNTPPNSCSVVVGLQSVVWSRMWWGPRPNAISMNLYLCGVLPHDKNIINQRSWGFRVPWSPGFVLGPFHTRDWEPMILTLQALVEEAKPIQVCFTLRSRDQRNM